MSPALLTEQDWRWWFGVGPDEARRLVEVQQALVEAGIDPCPDTVLGMSRTVLADGLAGARLRALAAAWDRAPRSPAAAGDPGWPLPGAHDCRRPEGLRCRRR